MRDILTHGIEDRDAECGLISSLLRKTKHLAQVGLRLPYEALVEPDCQAMYHALHTLHGQGYKDIEPMTVRAVLINLGLYDQAGKEDSVNAFFLNPNIGDPMILSDIILDMHLRRLEINHADVIRSRAENRRMGGKDNGMIARLAYMQEELSNLQRLVYDDEAALSSLGARAYYEALMNRRERHVNDPKMLFLWEDLHPYCPSLQPGDLVILVAESGVGKTALLEHQSEYLWEQGYKGVFYHLELSTDRMMDRRIARNTGVSLRLLQDGRKTSQAQNGLSQYEYLTAQEREQVLAMLGTMSHWPGELTLKHCPGWSMGQICADIRVRVDAGELDYAVVDYFNKAEVEAGRNSYLTYELSRSIENLKITTEQCGIVSMMAAQMDKASKQAKGIKTLVNAANTSELDNKANVGMYFERPMDPLTGDRPKQGKIRIVKCNSGYPGAADIFFDGPRFRLLPAAREEGVIGF